MQSDQQIYHQKVVPPLAYQFGGNCMYNGSMAPGLGVTLPGATKHSSPLNGVELQPFEVCPKNYIIFDQTDNRSRVMFHPALAQKFSCAGFDIQHIENERGKNDEDKGNRGSSSSLKEDTEDIDILLSLEQEEEDGDEVSTAQTVGSCGSSSSDSCSNYGSKPSKQRLSFVQKLCSGGSNRSTGCKGERKRLRMKKMVKALRGIVLGGDQMSTVAVLDEAVRYLQSLKVEVNKLGLEDLKM
ncbi:transcription factor bHLH144-like [Telopea speciosissima]|uniref:transcription factor bHLH144-like n=1 Tax=Telopea speciosissima TaxID=54955 RepID=UPI001CC824F7|nr:transcription factor bHLH144-like [Telopea speciosissima]XP_043688227.1 transcription factor bHLH144-like [Telopea speciosissima]